MKRLFNTIKRLHCPVGLCLFLIPLIQSVCFGFYPEDAVRITLAAFWEEILFRLILPKMLQRQLSYRTSILISAVIFGLFHGVNLLSGMSLSTVLPQIIYAACAGLAFSALYWECGTIWPVMLLHALLNLTVPANLPHCCSTPAAVFGCGFILYGFFVLRDKAPDTLA